jgi:hypothetical protein
MFVDVVYIPLCLQVYKIRARAGIRALGGMRFSHLLQFSLAMLSSYLQCSERHAFTPFLLASQGVHLAESYC